MADRYWVGGTAAWDGTAGTKWATTSGGAGGASVPTSADAVFFTNLSTGTCTISAGNTGALSINCTGHTGTIAGSAAISVAGSVTLVAGQTFTYTGTLTITATATLTTGGKTLGAVTINAAGGTVTLGSALTCTGIVTLIAGTLTTSGSNYAITSSYIDASGSTTRVLTLNGSTITGTSGQYSFYVNTTTGITFNAGTSTIVASNAGSLYGDGLTFRNITYNNTSMVGTYIGFSSCNTLTLTAPTAVSAGLSFYGVNTSTISTLAFSGTTAVKRIMLCSSSLDLVGGTANLTVTSVTGLSDVDFRDIAFNSSRSGTRLGNCGGNSNITFPAAKTVYWNLTGTQSWGATGWATSSGGTPAVNNFPLAQDTVVFDDTGAATQVNIDASWNIGTLNMSARTSALTINFTGTCTFYGSLTTGSGITYSGTALMYFANRSAATLTSAGKTFTNRLQVSCFGSTLTLQDAFTSSNSGTALSLGYGTFNANGYNITLSSGTSDVDLGTTSSRSSSATRTFALGSGTLTIAGSGVAFDATNLTGLTVTGTGAISMTSASAKTFSGRNVNYDSIALNQGGAGALTVTGSNTLGSITNTYGVTGATSILFTAGTTTTLASWNAVGTAGKLLTIGSVTAASHTLSKSSGVVNANYLSVSRSTATGGAAWYAGANSTNGGNNSGWIFANAPSSGFFMFF